jgi:hypothetical protein
MCYVQIAMAAIAVVASVVQNRAANKAAKAQEQAIRAQADQRRKEVSAQASVELNERARAVRRAKASARAAASEAGVNLSSGSFLAQLTAFDVDSNMSAGVVTANRDNALKATDAQLNTGLARIQYKTGLGIAMDAGVSGVGAYTAAGGTFGKGATESWTPIFSGGKT